MATKAKERTDEEIMEAGRKVMENRDRQDNRRRAGLRALEEKAKAEGWDDEDVQKYGAAWDGDNEAGDDPSDGRTARNRDR